MTTTPPHEETTCIDHANHATRLFMVQVGARDEQPLCVSHLPWHAVRFVSGVRGVTCSEVVAAKHLTSAGWRVHLPLMAVYRRDRAGKEVDSLRPLFPGYGFVQAREDDPWCSTITSAIIGVRDVLRRMGDRPCVMSGAIVQALMDKGRPSDGVIDERYDGPEFPVIPNGTSVKITAGPFADIHGVCRMSSDHRVLLMIQVMGAERTITVPRGDIQIT